MAGIHTVPSDWAERVASLAALTTRPWFGGLEGALTALSSHPSHLHVTDIDRLFAWRAGVRFEAQTEVRKRGAPFDRTRSYDGSITRRGVVPTREGSMHDLMNAVIWSVYPLTKRALHARQDAALAREVDEGQTALPGRRSRLRDRLSMLDEGGVIVWARHDHERVAHALASADLDALAALARDGSIGARVIGHAILEHATMRDPHEVRGCVVEVAMQEDASLDHVMAAALARDDDDIERWIARHPSIAIGALFP